MMTDTQNLRRAFRHDRLKIAGLVAVLVQLFLLIVGLLLFDSHLTLLALVVTLPFVLFVFFSDVLRLLHNPGVFVFFLITAMKYYVSPMLMVMVEGQIDRLTTKGTVLFLYEEVVVLGLMAVLLKTKYRRDASPVILQTPKEQPIALFVIILILAAGLIVLNPAILRQYNLIFSQSGEVEIIKGRTLITGLGGMLVDWSRILLPLVACIIILRCRISETSQYIAAFACLVLFNIMVLSGSSRNSAILPTLAGVFTLVALFPKRRKISLAVCSVILVVGIVLLTQIKSDYTNAELITIKDYSAYVNSYFSGPENVSVAIEAYDTFGFAALSTRLTDLFGNFPGISSLFDLTDRTSTFFNYAYYGGAKSFDQVIPMVGQGLFHFGYLLSVVPSAVSVWLISVFDRKFQQSSSIVAVFLYAYAAVRCAMFTISNMSILLSAFYSIILPLMVVEYVSRRMTRSKK